MPAATRNLTVEQNATFTDQFTWQDSAGSPVNLTGYTAKLQIRDAPLETATLYATLTQAAGITLGGAAGTVTLTIADTVTATFPTDRALVYDLFATSTGGVRTRLLKGAVAVEPNVTAIP